MKKRILPAALALLLALTTLALPAAAAGADDDPLFYSNVNIYAVQNAGDASGVFCPGFDVPEDLYVRAVSVYHYNYGSGAAPGRIGIFEWDTDECVGFWQAAGRYGNQWWDIFPDVTLEGGHRYYIDCDPWETWSFNATSGNECFAEVRGYTTGGTLPVAPSRQTAAVNVTVDGETVRWTDAVPFIDGNNRTMVPLRAVADAMGLDVRWTDETKEAEFYNSMDEAIVFRIGSTVAKTRYGGVVSMDTAPVIVNNRTFAPIRYLAEYFGYRVDWDGATKTVILTSPELALSGVHMLPDLPAYAPGATMVIEYWGATEQMVREGAWIAMAPAGSSPETYIDASSDYIRGTDGVLYLTAPDTPGSYELRFYTMDFAVVETLLASATLIITVQ